MSYDNIDSPTGTTAAQEAERARRTVVDGLQASIGTAEDGTAPRTSPWAAAEYWQTVAAQMEEERDAAEADRGSARAALDEALSIGRSHRDALGDAIHARNAVSRKLERAEAEIERVRRMYNYEHDLVTSRGKVMKGLCATLGEVRADLKSAQAEVERLKRPHAPSPGAQRAAYREGYRAAERPSAAMPRERLVDLSFQQYPNEPVDDIWDES